MRHTAVLAGILIAAIFPGDSSALDPNLLPSPRGQDVERTRSTIAPARARADLEELSRASGTAWQAMWEEGRALPTVLFGGEVATKAASPEQAATSFLRDNSRLVSGTGEVMSHLRHARTVESPAGHHVHFQQVLQGIPVRGSDISVHMNQDLVVQWVTTRYSPGLERARIARAGIDGKSALERAWADLGVKGDLRGAAKHEELVAVTEGTPRRVYHVSIPARDPLGDWEVVVDAQNGKILSRENRLRFADGRGRVFNPNPIVATHDNTLRDGNDGDAAVPTAAYAEVALRDIDGSGKLKGPFVDTTISGNPASEPGLAFLYTRSDKRFEQVMAYFHIDRIQRHFQSLGFDNVNNRQQKIDVHGTQDDNSFYSPMTKQITMGDGGVDDAEDADILLHEYGHSVQDNQVPGFGGAREGRAMGEGFGDYLASTIRADQSFQLECVGSWDGVSYSQANPPCLRRVDSTKHYPEDMRNQEHADGEIWSSCLWQINRALGSQIADRIILQHHFYLTSTAKFTDAAEALLLADHNLYGGAHRQVIRKIFADRGIIQSRGTLRLTLQDSQSGSPVKGRVSLEGGQTFDVPESGRRDIDLSPGSYNARVAAYGYRLEAGYSFTITEDQVTELSLLLNPAPNHTVTGRVVRADTNEPLVATVRFADTPLAPVTTDGNGNFSLEVAEGTYTVVFSAFGFQTVTVTGVTIPVSGPLSTAMAKLPPVLLVANDGPKEYASYYRAALDELNIGHGQFDVQSAGTITAQDMLGYETVVWFTGDLSTATFSEADQQLVKNYLQSGGRMLVTGQEVGYELGASDFYKEVLGATFVKDAADTRQVVGTGLTFPIEGGDGAGNQRYPDVIDVAPGQTGASEFLRYAQDGIAGIQVERGNARLIYLGFGLEGVDTSAHRTELMKATLAFLRPDLISAVHRIEGLVAAGQPAYADTYAKLMAERARELSTAEAAALLESLEGAGPAYDEVRRALRFATLGE